MRGIGWLSVLITPGLNKTEFMPQRLARLKRFVTSPFASICIFSPKNQGVLKNFPKVKFTLL